MQYKGEDLDLRVPQARQPRETVIAADYEVTGNGRWRDGGHSGRDPLWVDEVVLACCNYAYDIALANGAGEVGLEHLVNALTRVEAAARVLESRGVREAQLRRESAALVASEMPAGTGVMPRRSGDLEDVLRRAADVAQRRGSAASVDDVLWVLLHSSRELPAVQLLRRLTPDWQRLEWGFPRHAVEVVRTYAPPPEPLRVSLPPLDGLPARLTAMEESLRALHAELASDRKQIVDLVRDMQRDVVAQRGDASSWRADLSQRLDGLERGVAARPESARLTVQLSDRVQSLEKAVTAGLAEGARNWAALGQRLQSLETLATAAPAEADHQLGKALMQRLDSLEATLIDLNEAPAAEDVHQHLSAISQTIEARLLKAQDGWGAVADRLETVEMLVADGAERARGVPAIADRLSGLDSLVRERLPYAGEDDTALIDRLSGLERAVRAGFGEAVHMIQGLAERIAAVEASAGSVDAGSTAGALAPLAARLGTLERLLQDQAASAWSGSTGEILDRLSAIEVNAQRSDHVARSIVETASRLGTLEQQVTDGSKRFDGVIDARTREVAELHEALIRLSENQHTLASAIADWRHETQSDLGTLASHIDQAIETVRSSTREPVLAVAGTEAEAAPRRTIEERLAESAAAARADGAATAAALAAAGERQGRGQGFWFWLFGTDSIRQSNRDAELRWQRMQGRIVEARERRREQA